MKNSIHPKLARDEKIGNSHVSLFSNVDGRGTEYSFTSASGLGSRQMQPVNLNLNLHMSKETVYRSRFTCGVCGIQVIRLEWERWINPGLKKGTGYISSKKMHAMFCLE